MSINETIKSIHTLAILRDDMANRDSTSIVLTPFHSGTPADNQEPAHAAKEWTAQTYRGKGRWGTIMGEGATPEEALDRLLTGLVHAHRAVDGRRAVALKYAENGGNSTSGQ